jgi:hypothetical protein
MQSRLDMWTMGVMQLHLALVQVHVTPRVYYIEINFLLRTCTFHYQFPQQAAV